MFIIKICEWRVPEWGHSEEFSPIVKVTTNPELALDKIREEYSSHSVKNRNATFLHLERHYRMDESSSVIKVYVEEAEEV